MSKQFEAGARAQALCRNYGISDATFYKYKARHGGMNVPDACTDGRPTRVPVVVDDFSRGCLALGVRAAGNAGTDGDHDALRTAQSGAREKITAWRDDDNRHRPHPSLGNLTRSEFATKQDAKAV